MDTEIKVRHPRLKKYLPWGIAAVAIIAAGVWGWHQTTRKTFSVNASDLIIAEVVKDTFKDFVSLNGKVETGTIVRISALETGVVERKWVEEGAMLKPGDLILTLRNPNLRQQILDSESQLAEKQNMLRDTELTMERERLQLRRDILAARTELNRLQRAADRQKTLYDEQLTSREEYLKAQEDLRLSRENLLLLEDRLRQDSIYRQVQLSMMRESLDNMRENFALVRQRADNLDIRATHAGQLGSLTAELGQNIAAGEQVGQINILDNYKLTVNIDEHYINRVVTGLEGTVDRQGVSFNVMLGKVYPEVVDGQFKADLRILDADSVQLRVGQSYPVDLQLGAPAEALMLPRGQFFQSGGRYVYVVAGDGNSAERREIRIGRQNPRYYEIIDGVEPGERVIVSSYSTFGDADIIKINN